MKTVGILFTLVCVAVLTAGREYRNLSEFPMITLENHVEKVYIEPSSLYFSDEGIFLKTSADEWKAIGQISYDSNGYYLVNNTYSTGSTAIAQSTKKKKETCVCPRCYYENTSTNGVCERCLWPLYEGD